MFVIVVPTSDSNPNMLSLVQTSELGSRPGEMVTSHAGTAGTGGSVRSQSWMNTLSNASTASKKSSGGPASKILCVIYFIVVRCGINKRRLRNCLYV